MTATTIDATVRPVRVVLRATSPIHHGAGTSGNTALIRTQEMVTPDGDRVSTPFVSGNSLRHTVRAALAWHLAETLDLADGTLSKACVDLLWSGGALSQGGAQTDLDAMRDRHALLPMLPLMGYSHGPDIVAGSLRVTHAHLWCDENTWRIPSDQYPIDDRPLPSAAWIGEEFGTRHDVAGTAVDRLVAGDLLADTKTTQMIYDWQVVNAGSVWAFSLEVQPAVPAQVDALVTAVRRITASGGWPLAAKTGTGHGRTQIEQLDLTALDPDPDAAASRYTDHLLGHGDAIRDLLGRL